MGHYDYRGPPICMKLGDLAVHQPEFNWPLRLPFSASLVVARLAIRRSRGRRQFKASEKIERLQDKLGRLVIAYLGCQLPLAGARILLRPPHWCALRRDTNYHQALFSFRPVARKAVPVLQLCPRVRYENETQRPPEASHLCEFLMNVGSYHGLSESKLKISDALIYYALTASHFIVIL